jgi:subtilisin family serine protease
MIRSKKRTSAIYWTWIAVASIGAVTVLAQNPGRFRVEGLPEATGRPAAAVSKELLQRERDAAARGEARQISVVVRLSGDSLSSYEGTIAGLAATSPRRTGAKKLDARSSDGRRYRQYLATQREAFKGRLRGALASARVVHEYDAAMHGVALVVPDDQISALAAVPGVEGVYEDRILQPDTDTSPGFIGAPVLWNQLGGQSNAGENVVVGMLDTGIWPEHPSFADPDPSGKPYSPFIHGTPIPCQFGSAVPGDAPFTCNNKLVGARAFLTTYQAVVGLTAGEFPSARDDEGHGTHTSSTAAGNGGVHASIFGRPFGTVSGIAPRAKLIAYKVCAAEGCFGSDSAAAVNQAILDNVDVINFSIGGGATPYSDPVSLAFFGAVNSGVFVAASAGNSGPGANTTDHVEPWTMTVAASTTNRQFESVLSVTAAGAAPLTLRGASVTPGLSAPAPIVVPADTLCQAPFPPNSVTGKVVLCQRGVNARVEKSFNVKQGGAAGMILYNVTHDGLATDNHFVPSVHLEDTEGTQLKAFLTANPAASAAFSGGSAAPAQGDVMASFSSRGGPGLTLGISKPDLTAPGVQILAGNTAHPSGLEAGPPGELFQAIQGTSMSSPHIAGSAALLVALHPTWTPGQIKSALMMTATPSVVKEDGTTPANPFDFGSGRVDLAEAADPGFVIADAPANFILLQSHLWDTNYPSLYVPGFLGEITVHRVLHGVSDRARNWKINVTAPPDLDVVVPKQISVPRLGDAAIDITLDGRSIPIGQSRQAVIEFSNANEGTLRFPITVVRRASAVPLTKACAPTTIRVNSTTACTITITNTTFTNAGVVVTDNPDPKELKILAGTVAGAIATSRGLTFVGNLAAAQPPNITIGPGSSPAGGYLPLSLFGIPPIAGVGDDTIINFNVPAFLYGSEVYTRVGVGSNGYVVISGGSGPDVSVANQNFPNPARPNNVLAPFWTDLNPAAAGAVRIGTLTDGSDTWIVIDWAGVREFSLPRLASFEVWIGINTDADPAEDISFAYGTIQGNGDLGFLSVGAENRFGNRGQNTYYNGTGTLPSNGTELRVASSAPAPGETHVITFLALAQKKGPWTNCAEMTSNAFFGTQTACVEGQTVK